MLKKFVAVSAILAATTGTALANPAPYVGISTGVLLNTLHANKPQLNIGTYRGVPINLIAGYGGVVSDSFYLAGELTGTITSASLSDDHGLKSSYGLGASILPGIMINDQTLAFARIGIVDTKFPTSKGDKRVGGQFGVGLQTKLTEKVALRGEYDYVAYKAKTVRSNNQGFSVGPRSDQFTVGLIYNFE